jgi:hypothetical protein
MTYTGLALDEVLNRRKVAPDFSSSHGLDNPPVWIHRHTPDAEIYFVANQTDAPQHIDARFRVTGKDVQVFRPIEGTMTAVAFSTVARTEDRSGSRQPGIEPAVYTEEPGFTSVPLDLAERESVFVVFRNAAPAPMRNAAPLIQTTLATLNGPWRLAFPAHWGAPASVQIPELASWTSNLDPGVKYFSGTATYDKDVQTSASWFRPDQHLYLDLGKVRDIAVVTINGKSVGMVWAPPYRLDVTAALRPGINRLQISVTNEWTNRQIGDHLLPPEKRVLPQIGQTGSGLFGGPQQPAESGLLGSVTLVAEHVQ